MHGLPLLLGFFCYVVIGFQLPGTTQNISCEKLMRKRLMGDFVQPRRYPMGGQYWETRNGARAPAGRKRAAGCSSRKRQLPDKSAGYEHQQAEGSRFRQGKEKDVRDGRVGQIVEYEASSRGRKQER